MHRMYVLLTALLAAAALPATAQPAPNSDLVVSADWLARRLGGPTVVHVGSAEGFAAGHLPGARLLPQAELGVTRDDIDNELPPVAELVDSFARAGVGEQGHVVLYADTDALWAARALVALDYLGHGHRVSLLDGGLTAWRSRGFPVSTLTPELPPAAPLTPRLRPAMLVAYPEVADVSWALGHVPDADVRLLDARPAAQYTGAEPGPKIERGGHIPGAANVFWKEALVSDDNPVLKPLPELQALLADAGVDPGDSVITYCRTGGQASFLYFVSRLLGHPTMLYDGSYMEWSRQPDAAVATGAE